MSKIRSSMFLAVAASLVMLTFRAKASDFGVIVRNVICVEGESGVAIRLQVGDMLQIRPFSYPVTPKFLDSSLGIRAGGDRCLELIGQSSANLYDDPEGRNGRSAFFRALAPGRSSVDASLTNKKGEPLRGTVSYEIEVVSK